ncbi:MAG: hypothetical protein FD149_1010 [Rhodospirillaceae bacterium]|nr:MAG: hypothetical protein FD149_1010 [Rhodospirillaceae bacterium]
MELFVICLTALLATMATFFSGFGLGTVLLPVFALFTPTHVAVAATAVVHLANNLLKVMLVGRKADGGVLILFLIPAILAALGGATVLSLATEIPPMIEYRFGWIARQVTVVNGVIGVLMISFALAELLPGGEKIVFDRRFLPLGGFLSGFFGGLSGNQGALRSAFLLKCGLSKEAFIGTGVVAAVVVDMVRLSVYGASFLPSAFLADGSAGMAGAATLAAFLGTFLGARFLPKVTVRAVRIVVSVGTVGVGTGLVLGMI